MAGSVEAAATQVVGDDDVGDGVEYELDVGGVGRARLVAVDLLGRALVLRLELRLDVRRRLLVRLGPWNTHTLTVTACSSKSPCPRGRNCWIPWTDIDTDTDTDFRDAPIV